MKRTHQRVSPLNTGALSGGENTSTSPPITSPRAAQLRAHSTPSSPGGSPRRTPRSDQWQLDVNDLIFTHKIGFGTASYVYKGKYREHDVAFKVLKEKQWGEDMSCKTVRDFESECGIMSKVHSPFVVGFYGAVMEPQVCIVEEFCHNGSLQGVMESNTDLQWSMLFSWMKAMVCGLKALHSATPPIYHRDLKSANLLLTRDWRLKLGDFGSGREDENTELMQASLGKIRGTYAYSDPCLFSGHKYTAKSDVYSTGIVLWEMVMRILTKRYVRPYAGMEGVVVILNACRRKLRPPIHENTPPSLARIIQLCWDADPAVRPTAKELLQLFEDAEKNYVEHTAQWDLLITNSQSEDPSTTSSSSSSASTTSPDGCLVILCPLQPDDVADLAGFRVEPVT